jgi:glycosyltransferase involved in cell wall biosynthesis
LDSGLLHAAKLAERLSHHFQIELCIAGKVDGRTKNRLKHQHPYRVRFLDAIPREQIPWIMRSSHLLFSAEVNPPCPNAVIEALACGLPVIGFDTGSLAEIVQADAGRLVSYGANQWKLEAPDIPALAGVAQEVLQNNEYFRRSARRRAESAFGLEKMVDEYLRILL